ncbi:helix-turn-helix domain-containing protein [Streptomyces sp. URMC 126]|uniref:helix-turn-helix domain-containing protein n=1 Tax=Streptomyces sp. URMC 126 TaxID=3423401 RepID=UPI003F1C3428
MSTSPSSSARTVREALAGRLRELRLDAGLSGRDVAAACGWHPAKTLRLENAKTSPTDDDLRAWCRACGAEDQAADLIATSRTVESMYVQWRRLQRTGLCRLQESYLPLYERTRRFRVYSTRVMPGVLQTEDYARSLLSVIAGFRGLPDDAVAAARARAARSQIIYRAGHEFALLLEEDVLYYRYGDTSVLAEQLDHLLTAMRLPNVSLGIIPRTALRTMWGQETFTMFDDQRVHVELLTAKVTVTQPSEVRTYARAFAALGALAVHGRPARDLITAAIHSLQ